MHERSICDNEAHLRFPAYYVIQQVKKFKQVEQPDGSITCSTTNNTNTNHNSSNQVNITKCQEGKRIVYKEYLALEQVDLNASARGSFANNCAAQNCYRIYGNAECKVK